MTTVHHVRDRKFTPDEVFIGRPSKWGNPFVIGRDGSREDVISKFKLHIQLHPRLMKSLPELKDKKLMCFCHPLPCHGDVLAEFANKL